MMRKNKTIVLIDKNKTSVCTKDPGVKARNIASLSFFGNKIGFPKLFIFIV